MKKHLSLLFALSVIFLIIVFDQVVKYLISKTMILGECIDLLPFLAFYHTHNSGIAFSMLSSFNNMGLIILTINIILFVFWLLWSIETHKKLARFGYLFIIGGAIGNLIDRLRFHYVLDYVLFHVGLWSFAIFNLADAFITAGAIFILLNEVWIICQKKRTSSSTN